VLGRTTAQSVSATLAGAADLIDRIAGGDFGLTLPASGDAAVERVHLSLRSLVRTLRANAEAAESLAGGAYRRVAPPQGVGDRTGIALSRVAGYMDEMATRAHRIARGDLSAAASTPAANDTLGRANAVMVGQIVAVLREAEAMKHSIAATTEAMRSEVEELVAGTAWNTEQVRRGADRVAQIALQANASANRAVRLEERSTDGAAIVRESASAAQGSIDALGAMCRRAEIVQGLARNAGLLAVSAVSTASQGGSAGLGVEAVEEEVRQLATQAASMSVEINRLSLAGVAAAGETHLILDRMGDSIHESRYLVRELTATSRSHAAELLALDEMMSEAHQTARHDAGTARQLAWRVESLASQSRRLDALLRRFHKGGAVATTARAWEMAGPVLYRTPSSSHARPVRLAVVGK
jgi:methyl-accepting chemotaxis protein